MKHLTLCHALSLIRTVLVVTDAVTVHRCRYNVEGSNRVKQNNYVK
jgi:hypothetical protein